MVTIFAVAVAFVFGLCVMAMIRPNAGAAKTYTLRGVSKSDHERELSQVIIDTVAMCKEASDADVADMIQYSLSLGRTLVGQRVFVASIAGGVRLVKVTQDAMMEVLITPEGVTVVSGQNLWDAIVMQPAAPALAERTDETRPSLPAARKQQRSARPTSPQSTDAMEDAGYWAALDQ